MRTPSLLLVVLSACAGSPVIHRATVVVSEPYTTAIAEGRDSIPVLIETRPPATCKRIRGQRPAPLRQSARFVAVRSNAIDFFVELQDVRGELTSVQEYEAWLELGDQRVAASQRLHVRSGFERLPSEGCAEVAQGSGVVVFDRAAVTGKHPSAMTLVLVRPGRELRFAWTFESGTEVLAAR